NRETDWAQADASTSRATSCLQPRWSEAFDRQRPRGSALGRAGANAGGTAADRLLGGDIGRSGASPDRSISGVGPRGLAPEAFTVGGVGRPARSSRANWRRALKDVGRYTT